jgi:hypothetical protein
MAFFQPKADQWLVNFGPSFFQLGSSQIVNTRLSRQIFNRLRYRKIAQVNDRNDFAGIRQTGGSQICGRKSPGGIIRGSNIGVRKHSWRIEGINAGRQRHRGQGGKKSRYGFHTPSGRARLCWYFNQLAVSPYDEGQAKSAVFGADAASGPTQGSFRACSEGGEF